MSYSNNGTQRSGPSSLFRIATIAIIFLVALCSGLPERYVAAQDRERESPDAHRTYSFVLRGIPLAEALDALIDRTDINLFYESEMVENKVTYCSIEDRPVEDVLRCILIRTDLDFYQLSSGMYVLTNRPRAEAKFGALAGLVVDAHTGKPLPDAAVLLAYAETGTATNNDGRFALNQLHPGLHPVIVTHVAYEDLYDSLYVAPGSEMSVRYDLYPRTFMTTPIVVDGLQERVPSSQLASRRIPAQELILNPSLTPSTHNALNQVTGIGGGDAFADVHIQGGDSGEHLYALDGIPVFVPIRNGGFFGSFSPFALSQITVHKAGFNASEGSYLAGVVDIEHEIATDQETIFDVQLDALSANGRLQGSINRFKKVNVSWMMAGRVGLWELFQPPPIEQQLREWSRPNTYIYANLVPGAEIDSTDFSINTPIDIRFSDFHAATRVRFGALRSLYLSMYQGHNAFGGQELRVASEADDTSGEDYRWFNKMRQARYEWVLNHRTFLHVGAWSTDYELVHPTDRFPFSPGDTAEEESEMEEEEMEVEDFNEISEIGAKVGVYTALGYRHTLSGSIEPVITRTKFSLSVDPTGQTPPINHHKTNPASIRIQSFIQDEIAVSDRTQVTLGSRFTYIPSQQRLYAEPRLSVRHDIPGGPSGAWALFGATGLYRQFIFQFDVSDYNRTTLLPGFRFWIPLGENERASTAYHAAIGMLYMPAKQLRIRLESYYKYQPQLAVLDYVNKGGIVEAEGYAYGGGLSISYEAPVLRFQAQYEYGIARRRIQNRFHGAYTPVPWNAPHQLNANLNIRLYDEWLATIQWEGIFGRTWAYRQAYYDYLEPLNSQIPPENNGSSFSFPDQHRLRPFSQMDTGISYEMKPGRMRIQARISIINIWNRKNVFDWLIEEEGAFQNRRDRFTTPFFTSVALRIRY